MNFKNWITLSEAAKSIDDLRGNIEISEAGRIIVKSSHGTIYAEPTGQDHNGLKIFTIESSRAEKGYGPLLYDITIESVTRNGGAAKSDPKVVSDDAYRVWNYYYFKRNDVQKIELPMGMWYMGSRAEEVFPKIEELAQKMNLQPNDPRVLNQTKSWPIWSLWHAYTKQPIILNQLGK